MKTTKGFAVAAAVVVATILMTGIFLPRGMSPQQAFAVVIQNVANARMAAMRMTVSGPGQPPAEFKFYLKNPSSMRQEFNWGVVNVYDFTAGNMLTLLTNSRRAMISSIAMIPQDEQPRNIIDDFKRLDAEHATFVKDVEQNGRTLAVYDVNEPNLTMRIWVDKQTLLPVRIENRTVIGNHNQPSVLVLDEIEWDAQLDPALFAIEAPEGYQLVEADLGEPGPVDLVRLLRLWTTLSDGSFPEQLHPMAVYQIGTLFGDYDRRIKREKADPAVAWAAVARAVDADIDFTAPDSRAQFDQVLNASVGRSATYLAAILNRDWHWLGKGAELGDDDRIVCYWLAEDGEHYQAVDAKLELRTLTKDQLPQ